MSKKMKCVALDSSPHVVYGYTKKHQTLLQDYQDLSEDVETSRNKLENLRRRKMTLVAEVGFLRRRYKNLMKNKSQELRQGEKEFEQPHNRKNSTEYPNVNRKEATLHKLHLVPKPNQKQKVYNGHDNFLRNVNLSYDPTYKEKQHTKNNAAHLNPVQYLKSRVRRLYTPKEAAHKNPMPVIDLNQQERIQYKNDAAMGNPSLIFNSCQKESASSSMKQPAMQTRALAFDLNQIAVNN